MPSQLDSPLPEICRPADADVNDPRTRFLNLVEELVARGKIPIERHGYFLCHQSRLIDTLAFFGLWDLRNATVLEIGPFYSYTPFLYRRAGNAVTVLEGPDPEMAPLFKLYAEEGIDCYPGNLAQMVAPTSGAGGGLPFDDGAFDTIVCFETMEHLNFNPVRFVRELYRILKSGGRAFITVPNLAKLDNRVKLLLGRSIRTPIAEYYQFENYNAGQFVGFHWREYLLGEVVELFSRAGFEIELAGHLNTFIDREQMSWGRWLKRKLGSAAIAVRPDLGQNCMLILRKPSGIAGGHPREHLARTSDD